MDWEQRKIHNLAFRASFLKPKIFGLFRQLQIVQFLLLVEKNILNFANKQPKWLEFDNLLLAHSFALLEKSMFSQLHTTAQQRFENLLKAEPALFNHVPLRHIASMLGIAPESLSRLRKNLIQPIT